ncbi:MAG: TonB-dependent receptor, partial [Colwellia sp.]|nr:TonB-dependent receptor [Colwellia sp.]
MKTNKTTANSRFKLSKVALATSAVIFSSLTMSAANAAEEVAKEKEVEVIQVTGIRGGIVAGLAVKRNASNIVDAVSSEDMGKFPDANLAEALQRIPEVSIDRDGGEGRYITIRGLGPEFNQVLLNGRHVANNEPTRAFSFDTIAAELVSEMVVYKTQSAGLSEGGLGGTVDIKTARPLDNAGLNIAGNIKASYEENAETTSPQGSFLISNTFADDKVGILFGATYQKRENRTYQTDNGGVRTASVYRGTYPVSAWQPYSNAAYNGETNYRPIELNRNVVNEDRERLGLNAVFQYQPSDKLNITVDYLYSKFDVVKTVNKKSNWLGGIYEPRGTDLSAAVANGEVPQSYADIVAAESNTVVDSNGVLTYATNGATTTAYNRLDFFRDTETQMLGANAEYQINDDMHLTLDAAWSSSTQDNPGLDSRLSFESYQGQDINVDLAADVPYVLAQDPTQIANDATGRALKIGRHWFIGEDISAENLDLHADLLITSYDDLTIRTGFAYETAQKESVDYETPFDAGRYMHRSWGLFNLGDGRYEQLFNGVLSVDSAALGAPADSNQDMFNIDRDAVISYINDSSNWIDNGSPEYDSLVANGGYAAPMSGNSWDVEEIVTAAYIDASYDFMMGDIEATIIGGLRYSHTELNATGLSQV